MLSHNHHGKKLELSKIVVILCCALPAAAVYLFASLGVEMMSIGGFIPFLMLLMCPIVYLARAIFSKSMKDRYYGNKLI